MSDDVLVVRENQELAPASARGDEEGPFGDVPGPGIPGALLAVIGVALVGTRLRREGR